MFSAFSRPGLGRTHPYTLLHPLTSPDSRRLDRNNWRQNAVPEAPRRQRERLVPDLFPATGMVQNHEVSFHLSTYSRLVPDNVHSNDNANSYHNDRNHHVAFLLRRGSLVLWEPLTLHPTLHP